MSCGFLRLRVRVAFSFIGVAILNATIFCNPAYAHYPLLDCRFSDKDSSQVFCSAGFSDGSKAPNVLMEVFSEDDEVVAQGRTNDRALFDFSRPDGAFFIIMDAGPGHVIEIPDEEVLQP
mgnify:CR=1 FL=1